MTSFESREFRPPRWIVASCALGAVLFPLAAWSLYGKEGVTLLVALSVGMCALAIAGLVDALTTVVRITDDKIVIRANLRSRSYLRSEFVSATWAKDCPVALERRGGASVRLPSVGSSAQGVVNTLRAWLKVPN